MSAVGETDTVAVGELVDVLLDSATAPVVAMVTAVEGTGVVLEDPLDRHGRTALATAGEGGLFIWRAADDLAQAPLVVRDVVRSPVAVWRVSLTGGPSSCQRRAFVRAGCQIPVALEHEGQLLVLTAVDISEGGLRCVTREEVPFLSGAEGTVRFVLEDQTVAFACRVVRLRRGVDDGASDLGLSFLGLGIREADRLRKVVFDLLRRQRANESI